MSYSNMNWQKTLNEVLEKKLIEIQLGDLYVELDGVEIAILNAMFITERKDLNKRRGELLGKIKELEREKNA